MLTTVYNPQFFTVSTSHFAGYCFNIGIAGNPLAGPRLNHLKW